MRVWCQAQTRSMVGDDPALAVDLDPVQVGDDLDPAADHARVDRVVVGVQADVVVAGQPCRGPPPDRWRDRRQRQHRGRSAAIRSVGAHPNARRRRVFTIASQPCSWALKSSGPAKVRPGRKERSR